MSIEVLLYQSDKLASTINEGCSKCQWVLKSCQWLKKSWNNKRCSCTSKGYSTTQTFICLQTADGSTVLVEPEIAALSPTLRDELQLGVGYTKSNPICVPPSIMPNILATVFDYCRFHQAPGGTDKECKLFEDNFFKKDSETLTLLARASRYLQLKLLADKIWKTIAWNISNGPPEERHRFFNHALANAEPEKLERYMDSIGGSRGRLLKRLSVKKKKELEELENVEKVEAHKREDTNSVDDLVSFINGEEADSKKGGTKKKKSHRKKKGKNVVPSVCPSTAEPSSSAWDGSLDLEDEFDDADMDPAMKEKTDREVIDFARRLNVPYHEIRPDLDSRIGKVDQFLILEMERIFV
ncbi:Skp1 domain-containing protein [Heracleum sosnowskyi]|uniref:Skp1 domain-containing protein n=1 Tax=Heracleum sosnowskyi TaxID=360622 RepID=A0AAD8HUY3_9APIA|nr:Skp1 domain-containing protein [Heracleum sosnowskyi]